ncbi:LLM class flavin-dependent oxidoreductase [Achromobacter aloeverae]|uniref:LLM class flavin-dependent oxidoreductase n=1 Tax=Achromobacter aloeverae TaxID=1750518 RepID=A0A4Q1HLV1_9BURK|nr:LLM class flavin-dependent oxidoreductase [Achromobacter aloeverae]RXN91246.1 LLM class flavin-dependent oxidoreductase [Achromobacter aloeverae]
MNAPPALDAPPSLDASSFRSPADDPNSPLSRVLRQPLILGLFLPIQDGGWTPSTLPRTTTWTFDYNAALTRRAEALGFDLVFGLAQWASAGGYGGDIRYREISLDSFMATAALSACTERILLISTLHVLYGPWHPVHLAKFGATLDHISKGRWGINVVTGYAEREPLMFGMKKIEHDARYAMADVFVQRLKQLWSLPGNLTVDGPYWAMEDAFVSPKPVHGRPVLVNAAGSPAGIEYAARHSDLIFITSPAGNQIEDALASLPGHIANIRATAAAAGRSLRTMINPMVICRDTEREAIAYRDAIEAAADVVAMENFAEHGRRGDSQAWRNQRRQHRAIGGNLHLVGSPEQIVDKLIKLKAAGIDGVQLTFYDFAPDLEYFGEKVLPLLHEAGLRIPDLPATAVQAQQQEHQS